MNWGADSVDTQCWDKCIQWIKPSRRRAREESTNLAEKLTIDTNGADIMEIWGCHETLGNYRIEDWLESTGAEY